MEKLKKFIIAIISIMGTFANPNMDADTENATGGIVTQDITNNESEDEDTDSSDKEEEDVQGAKLDVDTSHHAPPLVSPPVVRSQLPTQYRTKRGLPCPPRLTGESEETMAARNEMNTSYYGSPNLCTNLPDGELSTDARDLDAPAYCSQPVPVESDHRFDKIVYPKSVRRDFEEEYHELKRDTDIERKQNMKRGKVLKFLDYNALKSKPEEVMLFDAAVVYDKEDFAEVEYFMDELKDISQREMGEELRIELYDSDVFEQSKVLVVEDVFKKCSVVLVYLTPNSVSEEFRLFIEEMVGLSRLALNNPDLRANQAYNNRKWILKPVHTQAPDKRTYKTPMGLLTLIGIEWYDKWSPHTRNQIKEILKNAIHERKRNEERQNIEINFSKVHRLPWVSRPLPPPSKTNRSRMMSSPEILHSSIGVSSASIPAFEYEPREPPRRESFLHPPVPVQVHPQRETESTVARDNARDNLSYHQQATHVPLQPQIKENPIETNEQKTRTNRRYHSEPVFQTARIQNNPRGVPILNTQNLSNLQLNPTHTWHNGDYPLNQSSEFQVPSPTYMASPFAPGLQVPEPVNVRLQAQDRTFQRNSHISADNPASIGDLMRDRRNDAPPSTDLSVVSRVTGKLIVNSNLSTGDVEIDTHPSTYEDNEHKHFRRDEFQRTRDTERRRQRRGRSSSYSESSADSESDDELNIGPLLDRKSKKTKSKTVNIVRCGNVQIGKGNHISQRRKDRKLASKKLEGQQNCSSGSKDIDESLLASDIKRPESKYASSGATSSDNTDRLTIRGETMSNPNESLFEERSSNIPLTENMSFGLEPKIRADKSVIYQNDLSKHSETSQQERVFQMPKPERLPPKYQLNIRVSEHEEDNVVNFENNLDDEDDEDDTSLTEDISDDELFGGGESDSVSSNAESTTGASDSLSLLNRTDRNPFTHNSKEFLQPWQRFLKAVNSVSFGNVDEVD